MGTLPEGNLRLAPRLVPRPLWGISAARLLPRAKWQRIRIDALEASRGACVVCGAVREKGMIGDEEWDYGDGVATLVGVRMVCGDCDAVTHIGSTTRRGYAEVARDHMTRINGIAREEADQIIAMSFREWRARSARSWTVAVAPDLLDRYPELAVLNGPWPRHLGAAPEPEP